MAKKENSRTVELQVNAALADVSSGDTRPDAAAYAYSAGGKLLDTRPLDAKGNASLKLPLSAQATSVRVLVGPRLPKETGLDEVLRRGAQESHLRVEARSAYGCRSTSRFCATTGCAGCAAPARCAARCSSA
jgi:hypothetical protein